MPESFDWTRQLQRRVAALNLSPVREAEIVEELSQHLDDRVRELTSGGAEVEAARHQALDELSAHATLTAEFGHLRQARTSTLPPPGAPAGHFLSDVRQDLAYAVRVLMRLRGFTIAAVLTLALGIGANTAIFSLVNATLFQRLPVRDRATLAYVWNGAGRNVFSYPAYTALRDGNHSLEGLVAWGGISASLNADGTTDLVGGAIVTGNYFDLLGVTAGQGRLLSPADDRVPGAHPVAVISHQLWRTRFGMRSDIVGHQILLNSHTFTVIGVTPPAFGGAEVGTVRDIYVPMMMQATMRPPRAGYSGDMNPDLLKNPNNGWLFGLGRLKPGVTPAQAGAEMGVVVTNFARSANTNANSPARRVSVVPVDEGDPTQRRQMRSVAWLLGGAVGAVLLIACANVANLQLSRATARRRELAVRLAIGANRWRLVRQLLTESVVLGVAGGIAGLAVAWAIVALVRAAPPPAGALPIGIDFALDQRVLEFCFLLSLVTGIVFGLAPALSASRSVLVPALKDASFVPDQRSRRLNLKTALVVLEIALALPLLIAAGLFVKSLHAAQTVDPGFSVDKLLTAPLNINLLRYTRAQGSEFYQRAIERVSALPGVESASVSRIGVLSGGGRILSFRIEGGHTPDDRFRSEGGGNVTRNLDGINANVVGPGFLQTLGIPLVKGRGFASGDTETAPLVTIISETTARMHFPNADPIGKRVSFEGERGPWVEIIGVARDSKYARVDESPIPVAYLPLSQNHETGVTLYVRTSVPPAPLIPAVRREIQALEPNLPLPELQTMTARIAASLYAARMGASLLAAFGGLALLLSAVGIYSVLAFSISRRTREMGIRLALGAEARSVFGLVVREGLLLGAIGGTAGLVLAALGARAIRGFLYGVDPIDAATFAAVTAILGFVVLAACAVPARRAMQVDPIVALRTD